MNIQDLQEPAFELVSSALCKPLKATAIRALTEIGPGINDIPNSILKQTEGKLFVKWYLKEILQTYSETQQKTCLQTLENFNAIQIKKFYGLLMRYLLVGKTNRDKTSFLKKETLRITNTLTTIKLPKKDKEILELIHQEVKNPQIFTWEENFVKTVDEDTVAYIKLSGSIKKKQYQQLEKHLISHLESGTKYIVLDFSQVTFISSNLLESIMILTDHFLMKKGDFVLIGIPPFMQAQIDKQGHFAQRLLAIYKDLDEALEHISWYKSLPPLETGPMVTASGTIRPRRKPKEEEEEFEEDEDDFDEDLEYMSFEEGSFHMPTEENIEFDQAAAFEVEFDGEELQQDELEEVAAEPEEERLVVVEMEEDELVFGGAVEPEEKPLREEIIATEDEKVPLELIEEPKKREQEILRKTRKARRAHPLDRAKVQLPREVGGVQQYMRKAPPEELKRKAAGNPIIFLLRIILFPVFLVVSAPFVIIYFCGKGVYLFFRGIFDFGQSIKQKIYKALEQKAQKQEIAIFEIFLSEQAAKPGPIERIIAQSVLLMKALQVTIGLKFIALASALDALLETITGYIHSIFHSWKMLKTIERKLKRQQNQSQALIEDLEIGRLQISRLFTFVGFYLEEYETQISEEKRRSEVLDPSFALKMVLEIRGHLDQMKRDLDLLTSSEIKRVIKGSIGDFLKGFIPNPMNILIPWKDIFVLTFFMRYSRQEIERMYIDLIYYYQNTLQLLEPDKKNVSLELYKYETVLLEKNSGKKIEKMKDSISKNRRSLQRLVQMLCNPAMFIYPGKWSRYDLCMEIKKMREQEKVHPQYALEMEKWLTSKVALALKKKGYKPDTMEKQQRLAEAKEFRLRYKHQQNLGKQFLFM